MQKKASFAQLLGQHKYLLPCADISRGLSFCKQACAVYICQACALIVVELTTCRPFATELSLRATRTCSSLQSSLNNHQKHNLTDINCTTCLHNSTTRNIRRKKRDISIITSFATHQNYLFQLLLFLNLK